MLMVWNKSCKGRHWPRGVVATSSKINARFNEDDSELIIQIRKAKQRFMVVELEELKTETIVFEYTKPLPIHTDGELLELENQELEGHNVQNLTNDEFSFDNG